MSLVKEQPFALRARAAVPRTHKGLSPERIAEVALELLDRDGLDALTMRRLAEELGVGTMTLYVYFRDKEELLDAILDVASPRQPVRLPAGHWKAQLRELMSALRDGLARHPGLIQLRLRRPHLRPGSLRITEAGMETLLNAGFSKAEAAYGYRLLFTYTFGYASFSPAEQTAAAKRDTWSGLLRLPEDDYPAVTGAASELTDAMSGDQAFRYGLDCLLDGLEQQLRSRRRTRGRARGA